jgi:outer membrane protein assembly factor BamE
MTIRLLFCLLSSVLFCSACGLIYKQNIQQGNALEQEDLDELYIGMNPRQVLFVLGTPSVRDPFHQERWDYVQTFSRRGNPPVMRTVTLRFEDGLLAEIVGQNDPFAPTTGDPDEVASFVKKPQTAKKASPQDEALGSAEQEVLDRAKPEIKAIEERSSEDHDYQRSQDVLDQTPDHDLTTPDIDG